MCFRFSFNGLRQFCFFVLVFLPIFSNAQKTQLEPQFEPQLEINNGERIARWTRTALLAHTDTREITIGSDVTYKRAMRYRALPLTSLLPKVGQVDTVQFIAADGFVANIAGSLLAGEGQAYLAIEQEDAPWPALDANNPNKLASAGAFYLVWLSPERAAIGSEQWPYQIATIAVVRGLKERFPQIVPRSAKSKDNQTALRGLQVYLKNCVVCHQINGGGDASIGPDLNLPFNPTAYFNPTFLRQLIRQPSSVRTWKQSQMPGFDQKTISETELSDLLQYLKVMAKQNKPR